MAGHAPLHRVFSGVGSGIMFVRNARAHQVETTLIPRNICLPARTFHAACLRALHYLVVNTHCRVYGITPAPLPRTLLAPA